MFQNARAGDGAVLGDMPDNKKRHIICLCRPDQLLRGGPDLADGAGSGIQGRKEHRLD